MYIKELFNVHYGNKIYHSKGWLKEKPGNVPLISSKASNRGVYGYFDIMPEYSHILTIPSTGSIGHAIYQKSPCSVDDNTLVMEPLIALNEKELIYYSLVLRKYAGRFMYGRQITPVRLGKLEVPSPKEIPSWVYEIEIPTFDDVTEAKSADKVELPPVSEWKSFKYSEIFDLAKGKGPSATEAKHSPGEVPYVGASAENNGITLYSSHEPAHQGNVITIATDGSVGEAFYQFNAFNATSNIMVITIKNHKMTPSIAMFLITLFKQEKSKFNYGRKWGLNRMKDSIISLPVDITGQPDWQLMEDYINSLPYSKYL
jgi:restriction endonuclease S subunit